MSDISACALCQLRPESEGALVRRPLVPREYLDDGLFPIDPLGTAGAECRLCPDCSRLAGHTLLHGADLEEFARAISLHREAFAPAGPAEERAARVRLWHRALHLGLRALVGELTERPAAPPERPEPAQLGLFVSKTARLAKVEAALAGGDFAGALSRSQELVRRFDLPEARYLAGRLGPILEQLAAAGESAAGLAALAGRPEQLLERGRVTVSLAGSFSRGLFHLTAEAAEREGAWTVGGRPTGWYWLRAGLPDRARAALEGAVAAGESRGASRVLLANLDFEAGEAGRAREGYRRAFCEEPHLAREAPIADPAVEALADEARELELGEEWIPLVGYLTGVFGLAPQPEGLAGCRDFHAALLEARRGGEVEPRRRMKGLAPILFERLRDAGRL